MYIHVIRYAYYYKNSPDAVQECAMVCPVSTSGEARVWFWEHISELELDWDQTDSIMIVQVSSRYITI